VDVMVADVPATWHFPLSPSRPDSTTGDTIFLADGTVSFRSDIPFEIVRTYFSAGYGVEQPSWKLSSRRILPRGRTQIETRIFRNRQDSGT